MAMADIIEGQDGWLFHGQGSNRWLDYLSGKRTLAEPTLHDWTDTLTRFNEEARRQGADLSLWIVPEKHTVLRDLLPGNIAHHFSPFGRSLETKLVACGLTVLDNTSLIAEGSAGAFHSKTDSHLNGKGAFHAYSSLLESLGFGADILPPCTVPMVEVEAYGDLGRKVFPPRTSPMATVCTDGQQPEVTGEVRVSNVGSVSLTRSCHAPLHSKLLIFGNSFTSGDLLNLLARTFGEVLFIFSPAPDVHILREFKPRYVLFQTNERFISRGPSTFKGCTFRAVGLAKLLRGEIHRDTQLQQLKKFPDYACAAIALWLKQAIASNQHAAAEELILRIAEQISIFEASVLVALLQRLSAFRLGERASELLGASMAPANLVADHVLLSNALQGGTRDARGGDTGSEAMRAGCPKRD